ncbi:MAG: FAD-dependent oxidoreductase [Anaerolineales bacterium]
MKQQNVVICGAGIAGISTAYHLAVKHGVQDILLIDERPPLSLTSDKSTECYRNWWPGPGNAMVSLMNHSIDLLEDLAAVHGNPFHLNRRGYLYLTSDKNNVSDLQSNAQETSQLGAGSLRIHRGRSTDTPYQPSEPNGFKSAPGGADLILDRDLIRHHYPFITDQVVAGLHIRRAGWFSAQQLGSLLLAEAKNHGVHLLLDRVDTLELHNQRVTAVVLEGGSRIPTKIFVNAAGPFLKPVSATFGVELPVYCELHLKVSAQDQLGIIPRDAPLLIWQDAQKLPWSKAESDFLKEDQANHWLLDEFPPGVHTRPEGLADSPVFLMLWEYHTREIEPTWPPPLDQDYPDIALRGLATMIPALKQYFEKPPRPFLDGGYYTKTRENRPLIGPLPVEGTWVIGALSGFGLMASMAAGELLALHILNKRLPAYAPAFNLNRYQDEEYAASLSTWETSGQL